ncbi:TIGR02206 family membrane protein [Ekhidna sp.]|uniref:YwaF family protein n=1 Tax=Ekhidna sp. TaxID=2608089 RepID=UPI003CCC00B9
MKWSDVFYTEEPFRPYGLSYFISILVLIVVGYLLIELGKKSAGPKRDFIFKVIASIVSLSIIAWAIIEIALDRFYIESDLPLIFCNLIGLFLPIFAFYRKQWLFDILYYIIMAGAVMSVLTPALKQAYPHYEAFKFWIVHGGLVIFILYQMIVYGYWPTRKGILTSFLFIQAYVLFIIGVNYILDANYLFLWEKPTTASILDILGPWPYYIIIMDLILLPYFFILYAPIWLIRRKSA